MSKLIKIKTNLAENNDISEVDEEIEGRRVSVTLPKALPLRQIDNKSIKRHDDYWEEKGHDTKISKIFQLAITTLSFLAFGGYLITLIISAIRRNSMSNGSNVIVLSSLQKYTRPKRYAFINDPMDNEFDVDKMYQGMIMLSEKYTSYHKYR
ncbi:hypothetical protein PV325_006006 [Microctonus aethiopoides]|nr:hypothetical protein PV325_006006 [Microctonus aethiopoides]